MHGYHALDEALASISNFGPELRGGMTNHGPMVAEALCALDRADAVGGWLARYRKSMLPKPPALQPIARRNWQSALGCLERFTDWRELIAEDLRHLPWPAVLDRWTDRLAPGISASATHGVIRVGHAARALAESVTPTRLAELADGLGYWAATYQTLPTGRVLNPTANVPKVAISRVTIVPLERRRFAGSITSSLAALDDFPEFADAIGLAQLGGDPAIAVSMLTETFARVFLANARDLLSAIVFIHGVTSAAAIRSLLPHISERTTRSVLRYGWQAGCALYATFANPAVPTFSAAAEESLPPASLIEAALANGDEHVIKFTEACIRENAINPSPIYGAAARHGTALISRR